MSGFLCDTNVLLDIATADPIWIPWSEKQFRSTAAQGPILINPIIYAGEGVKPEIGPPANSFKVVAVDGAFVWFSQSHARGEWRTRAHLPGRLVFSALRAVPTSATHESQLVQPVFPMAQRSKPVAGQRF